METALRSLKLENFIKCFDLQCDNCSGRPKSAITEKVVQKAHKGVMYNRLLKITAVAEIADVLKKRAFYILTANLGIRKLSARWVQRLQTPDQKM